MILPSNIHVLRPPEQLDYYDSRSVTLPVAMTPLDAWNLMMEHPQPLLRAAFWLRDTISACFGVKKIGGLSADLKTSVKAGDCLGFFLIEYVAPDVLVLTVRDRHLDVMTCISSSDFVLTITSSVVTHNSFGRIYMLPVGPAHKLIVRSKLRRLRQRLLKAGRA